MKNIVLDVETTGLDYVTDKIIGLGMASAGVSSYEPWSKVDKNELKDILLNDNCIFHNGKFDVHFLYRAGLPMPKHFEDTMLMSYLLDENNNKKHGLEALCIEHLEVEPWKHLVKKYMKDNNIDIEESGYSKVPFNLLKKYGLLDVENNYKLWRKLKALINTQGLLGLYNTECQLTPVLVKMEDHGVLMDLALLKKLSLELKAQSRASEKKAYKIAGHSFNIQSEDELGQVLYKELKLPVIELSKKSQKPKTDEYTLDKLHHEIVPYIKEYRLSQKLDSTYCEPFLADAGDGILRCKFNQAGARTGRFSSSEPNLQNVPNGHSIRNTFLVRPGFTNYYLDYKQMELVIYANNSQDPYMMETLIRGEDLHKKMAQKYFNKEDISEAERDLIKKLNFGIIYGLGARGISYKFNKPYEEACQILWRYRATFPLLKKYNDSVTEKVKHDGYVKNPFGRIRRLNADEAYKGVNALVQGTCSDIMKLDLIGAQNALCGAKSALLLTIHDELVVEIAPKEEYLVPKLKTLMENYPIFKVPLKVDISKTDKNWGLKEKIILDKTTPLHEELKKHRKIK